MSAVGDRSGGAREVACVASWACLLIALASGCAFDSSAAPHRAHNEPVARETKPVEASAPEGEPPAAAEPAEPETDHAAPPAAGDEAAENVRPREAEVDAVPPVADRAERDPVADVSNSEPVPPVADEPADPPVPPRPRLPPLPAPSEGACAFEPRPTPETVVDNPNCPDGIWHGMLSIHTPENVEKARGCTRVTGQLIIHTKLPTVRGLEALRVVERSMYFNSVDCSNPRCTPARVLTSLEGLDGLRCVGGDLRVNAIGVNASALRNVVEVGGDLDLPFQQAPAGSFASLRRVWGNLSASYALEADSLEAVYGSYSSPGSDASPTFYVGCGGNDYCRDGVLGCDAGAATEADFARFSKCEIAVHGFAVADAALDHLDAFPPLRSIRGSLYLGARTEAAPAVQTVSGLDKLRIAAGLSIYNLPQLRNFDGLAHVKFGPVAATRPLEFVAEPENHGSVILRALPQLEDLRSLARLEALGQLYVSECAGIEDLSGLDAMRELGSAYLGYNPSLRTLDGVPNLQTLGYLELVADPVLEDLSGLAGLERLTIHVENTPALKDLQSLQGVEVKISSWSQP